MRRQMHIARGVAGMMGVLLVLLEIGCDSPMDIGTASQQPTSIIDTAYVAIDPPFGGFSQPEGMLLGRDQLLYVADTRANRIVMLNRAGGVLSIRTMLHPVSLSQDTRLDLLVGGELLAANGDTVGAIFRLHLVSASADSAHRLDKAPIDTVWRELAHPRRRIPGIAVLPDNSYSRCAMDRTMQASLIPMRVCFSSMPPMCLLRRCRHL